MSNKVRTLFTIALIITSSINLAKSVKIKAKDISQTVKLSTNISFKLNSDWMKHPPLQNHLQKKSKNHKVAPSYPFIEHKNILGLVGTLSLEKKEIKHKEKLKNWSEHSCSEFVRHFPKDHVKLKFNNKSFLCTITLPATTRSKGMITYRRAHWINSKLKNKAMIVTTNFFTPMLSTKADNAQWNTIKKAVEKLMKRN